MKLYCKRLGYYREVIGGTVISTCSHCRFWDFCIISRFRNKSGELIDEPN